MKKWWGRAGWIIKSLLVVLSWPFPPTLTHYNQTVSRSPTLKRSSVMEKLKLLMYIKKKKITKSFGWKTASQRSWMRSSYGSYFWTASTYIIHTKRRVDGTQAIKLTPRSARARWNITATRTRWVQVHATGEPSEGAVDSSQFKAREASSSGVRMIRHFSLAQDVK